MIICAMKSKSIFSYLPLKLPLPLEEPAGPKVGRLSSMRVWVQLCRCPCSNQDSGVDLTLNLFILLLGLANYCGGEKCSQLFLYFWFASTIILLVSAYVCRKQGRERTTDIWSDWGCPKMVLFLLYLTGMKPGSSPRGCFFWSLQRLCGCSAPGLQVLGVSCGWFSTLSPQDFWLLTLHRIFSVDSTAL